MPFKTSPCLGCCSDFSPQPAQCPRLPQFTSLLSTLSMAAVPGKVVSLWAGSWGESPVGRSSRKDPKPLQLLAVPDLLPGSDSPWKWQEKPGVLPQSKSAQKLQQQQHHAALGRCRIASWCAAPVHSLHPLSTMVCKEVMQISP